MNDVRFFEIGGERYFPLETTVTANNNPKCPICLGGFERGQEQLSHSDESGEIVGHDPFHRECLEEWLPHNPSCPVDRLRIYPDSNRGKGILKKAKQCLISMGCGVVLGAIGTVARVFGTVKGFHVGVLGAAAAILGVGSPGVVLGSEIAKTITETRQVISMEAPILSGLSGLMALGIAVNILRKIPCIEEGVKRVGLFILGTSAVNLGAKITSETASIDLAMSEREAESSLQKKTAIVMMSVLIAGFAIKKGISLLRDSRKREISLLLTTFVAALQSKEGAEMKEGIFPPEIKGVCIALAIATFVPKIFNQFYPIKFDQNNKGIGFYLSLVAGTVFGSVTLNSYF